MGKKEEKTPNSKVAAKERLHLVLMQDRANVSADFLELMKQEIIDVIKKYIEVDENAIDVRLTNKENDDGTNGAPALYANIPIINIKNETRKIEKLENKEKNEVLKKENIDEKEKKSEKVGKVKNTEKDEQKTEKEEKKDENKTLEEENKNSDKDDRKNNDKEINKIEKYENLEKETIEENKKIENKDNSKKKSSKAK